MYPTIQSYNNIQVRISFNENSHCEPSTQRLPILYRQFALHLISIEHWQIHFRPNHWWSKKTGRCYVYTHTTLLICWGVFSSSFVVKLVADKSYVTEVFASSLMYQHIKNWWTGTCLTGLIVVSLRITCNWMVFKWWHSVSLLGQLWGEAELPLEWACLYSSFILSD